MIVIFIGITSIKFLLKNNSIGTYYLFRAVSWSHFVKATKDMNSEKLSYGTICSENELDSKGTKLIDELIQKGDNDTKIIFGKLASYPLRIVMYPSTEEYEKATNTNGDSFAYTDSYAIYLSLDELNSHNFIHEYTHFKTVSFCKDNYINLLAIPMWFQEGLAEYMSFQYSENNESKSLTRIKNFSELNNQKEFTKARLDGYTVYCQSYLAIKKIVELKGEKSIQNILLDSKHMNFSTAFQKDLGLNIEDLQKLLK